jgi:hypothetical protein
MGVTLTEVRRENGDGVVELRKLTGNIAADAADLLDNPDSPVADRMAWIS